MTLLFDTLNTTTQRGASVLWLLKQMLVGSCGWTVPRSGNGTIGGAGDNIATEGDLANPDSWMVIRRPDDGAEWCFHIGADTSRWDILYSKEALFVGGTSSARATATDERFVITSDIDTFYGNITNIIAQDTAPYGFLAFNWHSSGATMGGIIYDPMIEPLKDDPDPYICGSWPDWDSYDNVTWGDANNDSRAKGWSFTHWGAIPGGYYWDTHGLQAIPSEIGDNPYSGTSENGLARIHHARSAVAGTRGGWKGISTFCKWIGTTRAALSRITVGSDVWVVHGRGTNMVLPWEPGVLPTAGSINYVGEYLEKDDIPSVIYYKRARDDGFDPSIVFVYWQTEDPNGAYPGTPSGTLQDEIVVGVENKTS